MQLGFGKWNTLSIHLQGSPASATWINSQPCLKTVFRERHPEFQTGWVFYPDTAQWVPPVRYFSITTKESNTSALLSTGTVLFKLRLVMMMMMKMQQQGVSVLLHPHLPSPQWPHSAEWDGNVQPEQWGPSSAQPPHTSGEVCWTSTFTQNLPQRSSVHVARSDYQPALTSGYFLHCLLIDRLSIKINACFTLISGNLGLYFQQSCLGQASVLSHCTSKRLLDFPRLFPRKVIFLCCIYVFNCRH